MSLQDIRKATVRQGHRQAERVAREAKPWVVRWAQFGFAAKGVVYLVIGLLALQAAVGPGGKTSDGEGALKTILGQPFGQVLVGVLAVGLLGHALWRFIQAIWDPEGKGADARGLLKRGGYAVSGLAYGGLAVTAVRLTAGVARSRGSGVQDWTADFMAKPFGGWLVAAVGLVVMGIALNGLYIAWSARFCKKLKLDEMSPAAKGWARRTGRIGLAARGIVLGLIGIFLIDAALEADPREARGLSGALAELARQPYGPWLLGAVALGFVAYGLYTFLEAKYRRVYL
jgi:hypothetical protein